MCHPAGKTVKVCFCLTTPLEHIDFVSLSSVIGRHSYGHVDTLFRRKPAAATNRLLFSISSKGSFICTFCIDRTVHTTAFDKPVVDHWLERKIVQTAAGSTEKDRSDDRPLQRRARYRLSFIPLPAGKVMW